MNATPLALALVLLASACGAAPSLPSTPHPAQGAAVSPVISPAAPLRDPCHVGGQVYCVLNPAVTQATIARTICKGGWDVQQRAAADRQVHFAIEKRAALAGAHQVHPAWTLAGTEWDHRMAGGMGGSWTDPGNLSLEFADEPRGGDTTHNRKDDDETHLHGEICSGRMGLLQAQAQLVSKWLGPNGGYKA